MSAKAEALDLTRRKYAYDGTEPDWNLKIQVPMALADFAFSFAEIANHPFQELEGILGTEAFAKILEGQGYKVPLGDFATFKGEDNLPVYYYIRAARTPDAVRLLLVSMGEYQPGRYMAHFEGVWRITGSALQVPIPR